MHRRAWLSSLMILIFTVPLGSQAGGKKRRPLPYEFGRVTISNYSQRSSMAPVVFEHWLHRSMYTCRVCHVDVGFAMKPGASNIKAADNMKGYYCGACHNGRMIYSGRAVFAACSKLVTEDDQARCDRCHSAGKDIRPEHEFNQFAKTLPKERFGNGIGWQQSEELGLIHPADFVPGLSIKRKNLRVEGDFSLNSKVAGMPDIIFSHRKHTVWNGCELCHPEIFVGVKKGSARYSMATIFEGNSCGACHNTVAFPLTDCQRCHTKAVQP